MLENEGISQVFVNNWLNSSKGVLLSFEVQTEGYEGPISLLLSLISAQKVDLWELSIIDLVDAYLAELEKIKQLDLEVATEFLVVASTLLELKCRRLFPNSISVDIDEEYAFFEERDLLIARLLEIKAYRDASARFSELLDSAALSVARTVGLDEPYSSMVPDLLVGVTKEKLVKSLDRLVINEAEQEVDTSHLPPHHVSISQAARHVIRRIAFLGHCSFEELMTYAEERIEIVVGFLAILELYRQDRLELAQLDSFGQIDIVWKNEHLSDEEVEEFLITAGFDV